MDFRLQQYELLFRTPFRLSHGTRTGTQAVMVALTAENKTGFGEATFPPYLSEKPQTTVAVLEKLLPQLKNLQLHDYAEIGFQLERFALSPFTRNVLVNALTDLYLRINNLKLRDLFPVTAAAATRTAASAFTLTKNDVLEGEKAETAKQFSMLKLKLDGENDLDFVKRVREVYAGPICVDANQGWEKLDHDEVYLLSKSLKALGCVLIEQPFDKHNHARHAALAQQRILPVFADEGIQTPEDFLLYGHFYDGVNIKLLKCGGVDQAYAMAQIVRQHGKKVIVGCMSESSCGCAAALALQPLADYLDLDGPWLIKNDPFTGLGIEKGKFFTTGKEGFGINPRT